jgi:hypothetical protein
LVTSGDDPDHLSVSPLVLNYVPHLRPIGSQHYNTRVCVAEIQIFKKKALSSQRFEQVAVVIAERPYLDHRTGRGPRRNKVLDTGGREYKGLDKGVGPRRISLSI